MSTAEWLPGGVGVSQVRAYDWLAADGVCGGSPHLHTVSTEGYVVLRGAGQLETLSGAGYEETTLATGSLLWFSPGTVHRIVNHSGDLEILVIMQNAGLPEAGDAVLTFPPHLLADADAYRAASTLPTSADDALLAARRRRDLAIEGYLELREQVRAQGPGALEPLYRAAVALVQDRTGDWRRLWRERPLAQAERTGRHLDALAAGQGDHLTASAVYVADATGGPPRAGMCGRLRTWDVERAARPAHPVER